MKKKGACLWSTARKRRGITCLAPSAELRLPSREPLRASLPQKVPKNSGAALLPAVPKNSGAVLLLAPCPTGHPPKPLKGPPRRSFGYPRANPCGLRFLRKYQKINSATLLHCLFFGSPTGTRTPVFAVRGRRLNRLTMRPYLNLPNDYIIKSAVRQLILAEKIKKFSFLQKKAGAENTSARFLSKGDPPVPQNEKVLTRFSQVGAPLAASAFPFKNRPRLSA